MVGGGMDKSSLPIDANQIWVSLKVLELLESAADIHTPTNMYKEFKSVFGPFAHLVSRDVQRSLLKGLNH